MRKRFISAVLALLMVASSFPMSEFASFLPDATITASAEHASAGGKVEGSGMTINYATVEIDENHAYLTATVSGDFYTVEGTVAYVKQAAIINLINSQLAEKELSTSSFDYVEFRVSGTYDNVGHLSFANGTEFRSVGSLSGLKNLQTIDLGSGVHIIGSGAFSGLKSFKGNNANSNVMDLSGIVEIGDSAFQGCITLDAVTMYDGLTKIGTSAFSGCTGINTITVPGSVEKIFPSAFASDENLVTVNFSSESALRYLGTSAFSGCKKLNKVYVGDKENTLPSGLDMTGDSVFNGCTSLQNFTIPKNFGCVSVGMFNGCTNLKRVEFESDSNCEAVLDNAFNGCTSITEMELPSKVSMIGKSSFKGCTGLEKLILPDGLKALSIYVDKDYKKPKDDYGKDMKDDEITWVDNLRSKYLPVTSFDVDDSTASTFEGCDNISIAPKSRQDELGGDKTVIIPGGVKYIPKSCFINNKYLKVLDLGNVSDIGDQAFSSCINLRSVKVPDGVRTIRNSVFNKCSELKEVIYSPLLTRIEQNAFFQCSKLETVTPSNKTKLNYTIQLPSSVNFIGTSAFASCPVFKFLNIPDDSVLSTLETKAFSGCTALEGSTEDGATSEELKFPTGVQVVEPSLFEKCSSLIKVKFAGNVTAIRESAFSDCSELENVYFTPNVSNIQKNAFKNCKKLLDLPLTLDGSASAMDKVLSIADSAFMNCESLTKADLSQANKITSIDNNAFSGCKNMQSAILPKNGVLNTIGNNAFKDCKSLELVATSEDDEISNFPKSVYSLGSYAFANTGLKRVIIEKPDGNDNSLGTYLFSGCTSLEYADLSGSTVQTLPTNMFSGDLALTEVKLPDTLKTISGSAFSNCFKLSKINSDEEGVANIPGKVTSIAASAFANTYSLSTYNLPKTANDIAYKTVWSMGNVYTPQQAEENGYDPIKAINVADGNINFKSIDGVLYNEDGTKMYIYPMMKEDTDFAVPSSVETICKDAVKNHIVKTIAINDNAQTIEASAITKGSSLRALYFENNKTVTFNSGAIGSLTGDPMLVFYAQKDSTAETFANANTGKIKFIEYDKMVKEFTIKKDDYEDEYTAIRNDNFTLTPVMKDKYGNDTDDVLVWKSSDPAVATVDKTGKVVTKSDGIVEISATTANGLEAKITITVLKDLKSVSGRFTSGGMTIQYSSKMIDERRAYLVLDVSGNFHTGTSDIVVDQDKIKNAIEARLAAAHDCAVSDFEYVQFNSTTTDNNVAHIQFKEGDDFITAVGSLSGFKSNLQSVKLNSNITKIAEKAFSGMTKFKGSYGTDENTIDLSNIENIGSEAFSGCTTLEGAVLSDKLVRIESGAFRGCTKIKKMEIPASVKYIYPNAFDGDTLLAEISFAQDSELKYLGDYAFQKCSNLNKISVGSGDVNTLPAGLDLAGKGTFKDCSNLQSFTVSKKLGCISEEMFSGCTKLNSLTFENDSECEAVLESGFSGCTALTEMTLPDSVTMIGNSAYSGCSNLEKLIVPDDIAAFSVKTDNAYKAPEGVNTEDVTWADNVHEKYLPVLSRDDAGSAAANTFANCAKLSLVPKSKADQLDADQRIIIPDKIKYLPKGCFTGITGVKYIDFANVEDIDSGVFQGCTSLVEAKIPKAKNLETGLFKGCSALKVVELPDAITVIKESMFEGCTGLESVVYSAQLVSIEKNAFKGCAKLETATPNGTDVLGGTIQFPKTMARAGESAFEGCSGFTYLNILGGEDSEFATMEKNAFKGCAKLKGSAAYGTNAALLTFPKRVNVIHDGVFSNCEGLVSIKFEGNVTAIGNSSFSDCKQLEHVYFNPTISQIGTGAFKNCSSLIELPLTLDGSASAMSQVENIPDDAFNGCTSLTKADLSGANKIVSIGKNAFAGCSQMTELLLPAEGTLNTIFEGAFQNCSALALIGANENAEFNSLPDTVSSVGNNAFRNTGIENITIVKPKTETQNNDLGEAVFADCKNLRTVDMSGSNITKVNKSMFSGDKELTEVKLPDTVGSILDSAFDNCEKLSKINSDTAGEANIPQNVTSIGAYALRNNNCLSTVNIPAKTAVINLNAFSSAWKYSEDDIKSGKADPLKAINIAEGNPNYKSIDGVLYNDDATVMYLYPIMKPDKSFTVPATVKTIQTGALKNYCVKNITMSNSVTSLEKKAIDGCSQLRGVFFGTNTTVNFADKTSFDGLSGNPKLVFYGAKNSTAQTFANANSAKITFVDNDMEAKNLSIEQGKVYRTIVSAGTLELKPILTNKNGQATTDELVWSSSAPGVATVDTKGKVTPKANGTTVVTVGTANGLSAQITIYVGVKALDDKMFTLGTTKFVYDGTAKQQSYTLKDDDEGYVLKKDVDYELKYDNNINASDKAAVIVIGKGKYEGLLTKFFEIQQRPFKDTKIEIDPKKYEYDEKPATPYVSFTSEGKILKKDVDYEVKYINNENVGTATVKITGKGNYTGEATDTFSIVKRRIDNSDVYIDISPSSFKYDGKAKKPVVTVADGIKPLFEGKDYTLEYKNNVKVGTATVIITGKGKYEGTNKKDFYILAVPLNSSDVTVSPTTYTYDGNAKKPSVVVKNGSVTLKEGTDYTLSYKDNTNAGSATVTVTGKGSYSGTITKQFTIKAKSISGAAVTLSGSSFGYDGKAKTPSVTVKDGSKVLTKGKDYTVAYKNNTAVGKATVVVTGTGNYTGTKKAQFTIVSTATTVSRIAGTNRFSTAVEISKASYKTADTVVLAYGLNYADALAGVTLANKLNAPILLTHTAKLPDETLAEIKRLKAKKVIILGGTGAISTDVEKLLKKNGMITERVAGKSRFGTATEIAKKLNSAPTEVFFVYAFNYADALSVSTVAALKNAPIIYLKTSGDLDADTAAYLKSIKGKVKNAYVIGGKGVISDDMMKKAGNALGLKVNNTITRVAGANRYATCVEVNTRFASTLTGTGVCVAKGLDFPDALAGGVFAAKNKAPLFLADGALKDEHIAYLKAKKPSSIYVFGGVGAVPDELVSKIKAVK